MSQLEVSLSETRVRNSTIPRPTKLLLCAIGVGVLTFWILGSDVGKFHRQQWHNELLMDRAILSEKMQSLTVDSNVRAFGFSAISSESPKGFSASNESTVDATELKFYILSIPEVTYDLVQSEQDIKAASTYYQTALNEESVEMWLHRAFEKLPQRTLKLEEADVFVIVGYWHLFNGLRSSKQKKRNVIIKDPTWQKFVPLYRQHIIDPSKPHLLLVPTWNPQVSRNIGIHAMVNMLQGSAGLLEQQGKLWSVGFERNPSWQKLSPNRIIPIPYVVAALDNDDESNGLLGSMKRVENSVFYAGDARKNAESWGGCYRTHLVTSLQQQEQPVSITGNHSNLFNVRILGKKDRIEQEMYNGLMKTSDWCLILCGDTPTSRTLASSIVSGCLPIRVGSRLRGLCEDPCHRGFGWVVTGEKYPHLPYGEKMGWDEFPEVKESELLNATRRDVFISLFAAFDEPRKEQLRSKMKAVRQGWIYGWGDPVTSIRFGDAAQYIWESFVAALQQESGVR